MDLIVNIIVGIMTPVFTYLIFKIFKGVGVARKEHEYMRDGMMNLMKNNILVYSTKKDLSIREKEHINDTHDLYKKLGGNGFIDGVVSKINKE